MVNRGRPWGKPRFGVPGLLHVLTACRYSFCSCFFVVLHKGDGINVKNIVFSHVFATAPPVFLRFFVVFYDDGGKIVKNVVFSRCCLVFFAFFRGFCISKYDEAFPHGLPRFSMVSVLKTSKMQEIRIVHGKNVVFCVVCAMILYSQQYTHRPKRPQKALLDFHTARGY